VCGIGVTSRSDNRQFHSAVTILTIVQSDAERRFDLAAAYMVSVEQTLVDFHRPSHYNDSNSQRNYEERQTREPE
jgi:hypothetical protein